MIRLGVNIDHVATLRQARGSVYPSPIEAALIAESTGADAITVHLREDRRHIQDRDVEMLRELLQIDMNLESSVNDEMIAFALHIKPQEVCLVPERREELTTEGGLDVVRHFKQVKYASDRLSEAGIRVSLFIDADFLQIDAALKVSVPIIEIHTGHYSNLLITSEQQCALEKIRSVASYATNQGMQVNAGHGLHYHNVQPIAAIADISELNIGHAIVSRSLFVGFESAIREMKKLMLDARK